MTEVTPSAAPLELNASTMIERIESGAYPREILQTIAAGFLPLPQEDLVAVLAFLAVGSDLEIANASRVSLEEMQIAGAARGALDDADLVAAQIPDPRNRRCRRHHEHDRVAM